MTESAPEGGARRRLRRAMLSALAGSGLTAVGLGGALPGGALGAETPTGTAGAGEDTPPPATDTATTPKVSTPAPAASEPTTTTSTTTTESSTSSAPPAASGAGQSGTGAGSGTGSGAGGSHGQSEAAPVVVVQRKQSAAPRRKGAKAGGRRGKGNAIGDGQTGKGTPQGGAQAGGTAAGGQANGAAGAATGAGGANSSPNGVAAPSPLVVAGRAGTLASVLGQSAVSAQALQFYRVPLFLLPIYQAAGRQYGVPWQILAAINEVETDYGNDLNVSSAGAVGWMQFMPSTWLQYGVDALGAGYADPSNPVDAIFAAARYLHAAGASASIRRAILAYNHSNEYVESVLLRAKLIASYPQAVIANLTGLAEGNLPVAGAQVAQQPAAPRLPGIASATAGAVPLAPYAAGIGTETVAVPAGSTSVESAAATSADSGSSAAAPTSAASTPASPTPASQTPATPAPASQTPATPTPASQTPATPTPAGPPSSPPPAPAVVGRRAVHGKRTEKLRFADLLGPLGAPVTAVQDGRIAKLGHSHKLGNYLDLQDIYGDVFTYAGLGSIAHRYHIPAPPTKAKAKTEAGSLTGAQSDAEAQAQSAAEEAGIPPAGMGRARLFAHPDNPVAKVAAAQAGTLGAQSDGHGGKWLPLRKGSLVAQGTILGHLSGAPVAAAGQSTSPLQAWSVAHVGVSVPAQSARLRFAIRPAGDSATVDPRPILANWRQLDTALHPKGARGDVNLRGATVAQVFLMSQGELERSVLSDPGIAIDECGRQDIAAGAIDGRVLAVLEFLSRSGLKPTVGALRCGYSALKAGDAAVHDYGYAVDITAVNGVPIAGHQDKGSIAEVTVRALLTLKGRFVPHRIDSLLQYPHAPHTHASDGYKDRIHVDFRPQAGPLAPTAGPAAMVVPSATATAAHSAGPGATAPSPFAIGGGEGSAGLGGGEALAVSGEDLTPAQWSQLVERIGALSEPTLSAKPSSAAIRDPQADAGNRKLGAKAPSPGK